MSTNSHASMRLASCSEATDTEIAQIADDLSGAQIVCIHCTLVSCVALLWHLSGVCLLLGGGLQQLVHRTGPTRYTYSCTETDRLSC